MVNVCEGRGGGRGGGCGGIGLDREGCDGRRHGERHVASEEHVVGLDDGADEEAGQGKYGETKAFGKILVGKSLCSDYQ